MESFRIHWSQIPRDAAGRHATEGSELFALWPSPVNDDVCFRKAGFTEFGDGDESWDSQATEMLTRLLAELSTFGQPRLVSQPVMRYQPWYRRLFAAPEPYKLRQQIELPIQWDSLPECTIAFGKSGVSLYTGSGHHIFWIVFPSTEATAFPSLVGRVSGQHPSVRTDLRWEHLLR